ncbi:MAG TPA: hypothetical protein VHE57_10215 [Mycobacteriales bacterium]|nr:hypothetical protein [Mycobacteriales bacterium]
MTAEDYHRPPIVAFEPRDERVAIWRFRIVVGVFFAVLLGLIVWITHAIVANTDGPGTVGGGAHQGMVATPLR